jgi:hypothetical protein
LRSAHDFRVLRGARKRRRTVCFVGGLKNNYMFVWKIARWGIGRGQEARRECE